MKIGALPNSAADEAPLVLGFTGSEPLAPERRAVKVIGVFPDVLTHCDPGRSLFDPDKSPGGLLEPLGVGLVGMGLPNGALSRDLNLEIPLPPFVLLFGLAPALDGGAGGVGGAGGTTANLTAGGGTGVGALPPAPLFQRFTEVALLGDASLETGGVPTGG